MKKNRKKQIARILAVIMAGTVLLAGCGSSADTSGNAGSSSAAGTSSAASSLAASSANTEPEAGTDTSEPPAISGLTYTSTMPLKYASCFHVYYYEGGYALIDVPQSAQYLVVPEGKSAPDGLSDSITVLQKPLDHIYLAATSAMALFDAIDGLDSITMSGLEASGWYIDDAVNAMNEGKMVYAGKYSEPDYELLVDSSCDLAIESTMILHTPKVQEMIEMLGIPVFTDRSSYESHPLGRTEWIKLYGVLIDKEDEAEAFFDKQAEVIEKLKDFQNTEKTVAFFSVSSDGTVVVRNTTDYIPKMIEIAGARYAFTDLGSQNTSNTVKMTMEEFYAGAVDADYLVYNAAIENPISSISDLTAKDQLFADFKAVKEGNVWCTGKNLYQATDTVGQLITDFNVMVTNGDASQMTFLNKIN